jgi:hypothetical protein
LFREIALYLTARADRIARRSGLVTQAVGLWSRAMRRRREWGLHYARCHGFIREALADRPVGGTVMVLGSGLVEDVPLDVLAARFERIILVDIVHLKPVQRRILADPRFAKKVQFETSDLTGLLAALDAREPVNGDAAHPIDALVERFSPDGVISAMCLSQLPRAISEKLAQTSVADNEQAAICRSVVQAHLAALARCNGLALLLSDLSYTEISAAGHVLANHDLLHGVALPDPLASWDWDVAPKGEVSGGISYRHHVGAWFWNRPDVK